ncbi:MAG TPA: hypothetical protein VN224_00480 [Xanthomonadales bacterium]|nr:hypothetical protein [Xanthomonadales bacterium]
MDALPIRPQAPHHAPHRASHRPAHRGAVAGAPHAAHAAPPASPGDLKALEEQAAFDAVASARAEQMREMNALRDLAMQQVKRDDQTMNAWIKLI